MDRGCNKKAPPVKRGAVQSHDPSKSSLIQPVFRFRWRKNWRKWRKPAPSTAPNPLSPSTSSVDGLHRREEQHVADGVGVGEQHDQAIHAEAEAARSWGQRGAFSPSEGRFSAIFCALFARGLRMEYSQMLIPQGVCTIFGA